MKNEPGKELSQDKEIEDNQRDEDVKYYQVEVEEEQSQQWYIANRAIRDDQLWSYFCLAIATLGIIIILIGAGSVLAGNTSLGILEAVTGLVIDGITALAYQPRKEARERLDNIYDKLMEQDYFNKAIELTKTMNGEAKNRAKEAIVTELINTQARSKIGTTPPSARQLRKKSKPNTTPQLSQQVKKNTNEARDSSTPP